MQHQLNHITAINHVSQPELNWLWQNSQLLEIPQGESLFKPDDLALNLYIILDGLFKVGVYRNNQFIEITEFETGNITGVLPYSRMEKATGHAVAQKNSKVLAFHRNNFDELIKNHHELTTALVHVMTTRVREFTSL